MYKYISLPILTLCLLSLLGCKTQSLNKMDTTNNLLCDPETGACELPQTNDSLDEIIDNSLTSEKIKLIYFTDPICSSCWGIEPQLRKLKLTYGEQLDIEYRMGGLLPDWSYNSGGISKPSDVAHHWDEVSAYYDMPIDGDVWLEDPLNSSYPPSIGFKAAQLQSKKKAQDFMRTIREMVFLQKINISKEENLMKAAQMVGLDTTQFKTDLHGKAKEDFKGDLNLARNMGVRGFPSIYLVDQKNERHLIYGVKPFEVYATLIKEYYPDANSAVYSKKIEDLFLTFTSLTAKEFAVLADLDRNLAEEELVRLTHEGKLKQHSTKNGSIWYQK